MLSSKRRFLTRLTTLILALSLAVMCPYELTVTSTEAGIHASVEKVSTESYAAAVKTVTVNKATTKVAESIHQVLKNGKPLNLKVKGDIVSSEKLLKNVNAKIKKVNKQGVVFRCYYTGFDGTYSLYTVTSDQAGTYQYAVKFVDKLYKYCRKLYTSNETFANMMHDMELYPDKDELAWRLAYSYAANRYYQDWYTKEYIEGTSEITTKSEPSFTSYTFYNEINDEEFIKTEKVEEEIVPQKYTITFPSNNEFSFSVFDFVDVEGKTIYYSSYSSSWYCVDDSWTVEVTVDDNEDRSDKIKELEANGITVKYELLESEAYINEETVRMAYSYEEFKELPEAAKLKKLIDVKGSYYIKNSSYALDKDFYADKLIYDTKNFCDLSDAMKVYAIDRTAYFSSFNKEYGMDYQYVYTCKFGKEGMKTLYKGKAFGVCMIFAYYENQLWDALDIEHYYNSAYEINHAWSVVKVKNSKGKVLWIPFDYGLEPSPGLMVDENQKKYNNTEAKRYKLYLRNIPGAPKKKNFKYSDFR